MIQFMSLSITTIASSLHMGGAWWYEGANLERISPSSFLYRISISSVDTFSQLGLGDIWGGGGFFSPSRPSF